MFTLTLTACGPSMPLTKAIDAECHERVPLQCAPLQDWDGSFSDAQRLLKLYGAMYEECDKRRAAGEQCLERLKKYKVVQ